MFKTLLRRWRVWRDRDKYDRELAEEMQFHAAMKAGDLGDPRKARIQFGNATTLLEQSRDVWSWTWLESFASDIRYTFRGFTKNPGFAALAIGTMALAIGAGTAIFSLAQAVLLRPLPFPSPTELTMIFEGLTGSAQARDDASPGSYRDLRESLKTLHSLAAMQPIETSLTGDGEPERLDGARVTANLLETVGVQPLMGRLFRSGEDEPGRDGVVVLSYDLWQRRFVGDPNILGKQLLLSERPYSVIGVMPPAFRFYLNRAELWTTLALPPDRWAMRGNRYIYIVGRRDPGISLPQVQSDLDTQSARIRGDFPREARDMKLEAVSLHTKLTENSQNGLLLLLGAVCLLLLIACSNVANLLLSRAVGRSGELAVRSALGAGSGRLFRQLITESLVLAMCGGLAGLAVAQGAFRMLQPLVPDGMIAYTQLRLDLRVAAIALSLTVLATLASGLAPAIRALHGSSADAMRQGIGRAIGGVRHEFVRGSLIVVEVALAILLLVGAGLLLRTFSNMMHVDPGFRADHLLSAQTILSRNLSEPAVRTRFYQDVLARVKALPGVTSAAYATTIPTLWKGGSSSYHIEGRPFSPGRSLAIHRQVTPEYFDTMGIRLRSGRLINEQDTENTPNVAVINEAMARQVWPGQEPIGKQFRRGNPDSRNPVMTVVGVVENVREMGLVENAPVITYFPQRQAAAATFTAPEYIIIRTQGDPASLAPALRREILAVNPNQAISKLAPVTEVLARELTERKIQATIIASFAGAALLLACIGIYGVLSYAVAQRKQEFGVRLALGAGQGDLMRMVVGGGLRLVVIGVVLGLGASAVLTQFLKSMLFQVEPLDLRVFGGVALVLLLTSLAASWIPARRTLQIQPAEALRL